ncbi:hypothetical protein KIPB_010299 [Kipferlia bialata]|uniref:Uncharacterized protein n=1 Tax=Kipferlia bialata TaxID=797122 RepID=A0A391NPP5_9EUKA|nr:hypothetical protein KIPB_010299 [Kipferlia bialata]|eukprot:g10299.t1
MSDSESTDFEGNEEFMGGDSSDESSGFEMSDSDMEDLDLEAGFRNDGCNATRVFHFFGLTPLSFVAKVEKQYIKVERQKPILPEPELMALYWAIPQRAEAIAQACEKLVVQTISRKVQLLLLLRSSEAYLEQSRSLSAFLPVPMWKKACAHIEV